MAVIRKAIVKRSDLPPLVIQPIGESKYLAITNAEVVQYENNDAIIYSTQLDHGFKAGDTLEIIAPEGITSPFAFANIKVLAVPVGETKRFYVSGFSATAFDGTNLLVARIPEQYYVRYRIVSEDLNRVSHWSPVYALTGLYQELENLGNLTISLDASEQFIFINWDMPSDAVSTQNYDVYVAWGETTTSVESYNYYATISGNSIIIPIGANSLLSTGSIVSVRVAVQTSTLPSKKRVSTLTVAESVVTELPFTP